MSASTMKVPLLTSQMDSSSMHGLIISFIGERVAIRVPYLKVIGSFESFQTGAEFSAMYSD